LIYPFVSRSPSIMTVSSSDGANVVNNSVTGSTADINLMNGNNSNLSIEEAFRSFMQQQQQTNQLLMELMKNLSVAPSVSLATKAKDMPSGVLGLSSTAVIPPDSVKPCYVPISELPKFSESISSEDAVQYLGVRHLDNLSGNDRIIVRTLKFLSFRSRFVKLTLTFPDVA
jgi:hypothetical protein